MIKINDSFVTIENGRQKAGDFVLTQKFSACLDIFFKEKLIRQHCAEILKESKKQKLKTIRLFLEKDVSFYFPAVAFAKIVAQEVYRHIREDQTTLKNIIIVLSMNKDFKVFNKVISGYLGHLLNDLIGGPFITVDAIIEVKGGIVLIKRSNPPFGWALPGGFVDYGESLEEAVCREALEETGLHIRDLVQMHTYSEYGRDPRFQTITTVFVCKAKGKPVAASDAQDSGVFNPATWKSLHLAFDHAKVLSDYLEFKTKIGR